MRMQEFRISMPFSRVSLRSLVPFTNVRCYQAYIHLATPFFMFYALVPVRWQQVPNIQNPPSTYDNTEI